MMVYAIPHKTRGSHVTFFSYEETLEYMNEIMKLVGGKIISFYSDDDFYWCQVRLVNDQRYLLYVSTIVRYAFEDNFSLMAYCAFHNKELRKHLNLINTIQLYLGYFCVCDNHSILVNDYAIKEYSPKSWFNNYKMRFTTTKTDSVKVGRDYRNLYFSWNIETKCLSGVVLHFNNIINKIFKRNEKSLCSW